LHGGPACRALYPHNRYNTRMKQFSEACEQNKIPILAVLREAFRDTERVLEIGSGTGQHAVYFASHLPHLQWQPSDRKENHASISAWAAESRLANLLTPLDLDVTSDHWPRQTFDGVFSANTTHIMSWPAVRCMFAGIGRLLEYDGILCLYGPFNYHDTYTSPSNERFDGWLRSRDPDSGIRNFEDLDALARSNDMQLQADHEMPVNNRLLVWAKHRHTTASA
jgi:cyclopropane fatty-acyl-phospholipid synthase-like methyltransferase